MASLTCHERARDWMLTTIVACQVALLALQEQVLVQQLVQ